MVLHAPGVFNGFLCVKATDITYIHNFSDLQRVTADHWYATPPCLFTNIADTRFYFTAYN